MRKSVVFFLIFSISVFVPVLIARAENDNIAGTRAQKIDQDDDIKDYPEYYKKRVLEFRALIRKEKTREAKIKAAVRMIEGDSPYKKDALNFLAEIKAKEAVPSVIRLGEDRDFRPETAYALGEIGSERGIEFLIRLLYDDSENVRGNASLALKKITGLDLGYNYSQDEAARTRAAQYWEDWWTRNKITFKAKEMTEEEKRDADEKWRKYGKKYLDKILSQ